MNRHLIYSNQFRFKSDWIKVSESVNGRIRSFKLIQGKLTWKWQDSKENSILSLYPLKAWMNTMFLPVGYPYSVHHVYASSHLWQFYETLIASTMSVLCSQSMLSSIGVSNSSAEAGVSAVAINWVLKDTIGETLKLVFIQRFAKSFDSHPKSWKLFGEICSLLGSSMQLCTILYPSFFLAFAGLGFGLRSIHYRFFFYKMKRD